MLPNLEPIKFMDPMQVSDEDLQTQTLYDRKSAKITYLSDVTTEDQMKATEASGVLDFWLDPEEEKYGKRE